MHPYARDEMHNQLLFDTEEMYHAARFHRVSILTSNNLDSHSSLWSEFVSGSLCISSYVYHDVPNLNVLKHIIVVALQWSSRGAWLKVISLSKKTA